MKRVMIPVCLALLFCGCSSNDRKPMETLPPAASYATQTTPLYTGTTVDFYYMSTTSLPRRPTGYLDMPEMPDFPGYDGDNPFDEDFAELFENQTFPSTEPVTAIVYEFDEVTVTAVTSAEYPEPDLDHPEPDADTSDETAEYPRTVTENETSDTSDNIIIADAPNFDEVTYTGQSFIYDINDYMPEDMESRLAADVDFDDPFSD